MVNTKLKVAPIPIKHAVRFVELVHRKLPHAHHRMWAIGLWSSDQLVGVALVGAPKARKLAATMPQGGTWPEPYERLEVVRVAVIEGIKNGCSKLYGACARAARGMGVIDLLTYTDITEPGTTLRAAGWVQDIGTFGGGQMSAPSRLRRIRTGKEAQKRHRWWAPWSEYVNQICSTRSEIGTVNTNKNKNTELAFPEDCS